MASDYGDEAGEKLFDDMVRFGERMGERAMYERSRRIQKAFENATRTAQELEGESAPQEQAPEWAKLDMEEFQGIEDYDGIKGIIESKLKAHGVEATWFNEPESGKEFLLFRVIDAREVWQSFDELSHETEDACAKAAERLAERSREDKSRDADERPLEERAKEARETSEALEAERSTTRTAVREPRLQEVRSK